MDKRLLVDVRPFEISRQKIDESIKENNGKLIVRGVLQRAEAKNQIGRIYPREILQREAKKYNEDFISELHKPNHHGASLHVPRYENGWARV